MNSELQITKHQGFQVVRGDLIYGGIKRLVLNKVVEQVEENELVSSAHTYGHSQLALSLAAKRFKKKVSLFYAQDETKNKLYQNLKQYDHVQKIFLPKVSSQKKLDNIARTYAQVINGFYFPLGLESELFGKELQTLVKDFPRPKELWLLSGSGATARALKKAWPETSFNIVNMGFTEPTIDAKVYNIREHPEEEVQLRPPYPSSTHYDAKLWYFVQNYASKNAMIWNMAK